MDAKKKIKEFLVQGFAHNAKTVYAVDKDTGVPYVGTKILDHYELIPALARDSTTETRLDLAGFLERVEKMIPLITETAPDALPELAKNIKHISEKFSESFPKYKIVDYKIVLK